MQSQHPPSSSTATRTALIVNGVLQSVRRGASLPDLSGGGAFAKRHCGSMAGRGFRLADPTAYGTAVGCLYVCRIRSPASARPNTLRLGRRNGAAAADGVGIVGATHFRLAVPVVGVVRHNNLWHGAARNCSALCKTFYRGFCVSENTGHFRRSPALTPPQGLAWGQESC
jgi:hypothetical protein